MTPLNLLLLDEPSNHLDIESCDSFMAALDQFEGAVLIVTHNEMFLHSIANRLIVFKNNGIHLFEGTYQEFLEKEGGEDEQVNPKADNNSDMPIDNSNLTSLSKKAIRQKKSEIIGQKSYKARPIKKKIDALENKIDKNEKEISIINEDLIKASANQDGNKIQELSKNLSKFERINETLFDDLEIQMDLLEEIETVFNSQLKDLGIVEK